MYDRETAFANLRRRNELNRELAKREHELAEWLNANPHNLDRASSWYATRDRLLDRVQDTREAIRNIGRDA